MKKMKLAVVFAALVSMFGFSSCLNDSGDSNYPTFPSVTVTVTGDEVLGYRLYADNGSILIPTSQSAAQLPGLSKVKRAQVGFDVVSEENITQLEPKKTYNVILNPSYCGSIPTSTVINTYQNEKADTLWKNQDPITAIKGVYAVNGYATTLMTIPYSQTSPFYMNAGYDSQKDVDTANNTLTLTVYYDTNSSNAYNSGQSLFSFKLPQMEYGSFTADSIKLVLQAKTTTSGEGFEKVECKMAKSDLLPPSNY